MLIAETYSFNGGEALIRQKYPNLLEEVFATIIQIEAELCRRKEPKGAERYKLKRISEEQCYSPIHLNALFDYYLHQKGWELKPCIYTHDVNRQGFREMDFIKGGLGLEVQFGKYAFLTYDIVAKMVIFKNYQMIDAGIEICPMGSMLSHLSSGIGAFEQVKWDLIHRGPVKGFDVPVLLIGVATEKTTENRSRPSPESEEAPDPAQISRNREPELTEKTLKRIREMGII